MYNKIKYFIQNELEEVKKKDPVLKNSLSTYLVWGTTFFIFLLPAIFLNENFIINHEVLKTLANNVSIAFPTIETKALIAESVNLYYYFKFINVLLISTILIVFILYSMPICKVYLCSLKIIKCKNKIYINKNIEQDYYIFSPFFYILGLIYVVGILHFSFYAEANPDVDYRLNYIFKLKIFMIFYNYGVSYITGLVLAILMADTFGRLFKIIKMIKKYFETDSTTS